MFFPILEKLNRETGKTESVRIGQPGGYKGLANAISALHEAGKHGLIQDENRKPVYYLLHGSGQMVGKASILG